MKLEGSKLRFTAKIVKIFKNLFYYLSLLSAFASLILLASLTVIGASLYLYMPVALLLLLSAIMEMLVTEGLHGVLLLSYGLAVGYIVELVGLKTGFPFGKYLYSGVFRLPGGVFGFSPLLWFLACYSSYRVSAVLKGYARIIYSILLPVALDLVMDPVISTLLGIRTWMVMGLHFGVPLSNYMGWVIVSTVIVLPYHRLARRAEGRVILPLIVYSGFFLLMVAVAFRFKAYFMSLFGVGVYLSAMFPLVVKGLNKFIFERA